MPQTIKSITVNQFDYILRDLNNDELDLRGHLNHYQEFDADGHLVKDARYNRLDELEELYEYSYDAAGLMTEETYYLDEEEAAEKKTFEYDESDKLARVLKHYQDGSIDLITYFYDPDGQLIRIEKRDEEGEIDQHEEFEWQNGKVVKESVFDAGDQLISCKTMTYTEHGEISELHSWNADDDTGETRLFQKDEEGNLISSTEDGLGPKSQIQTTYNEKGQPVQEEEITPEGDILSRVVRQYDAAGRELETEVFIDGQGQTLSRHYFLRYQYVFFED